MEVQPGTCQLPLARPTTSTTRDDGREQHGGGAERADPAQRAGAAGEHEPPEVADQPAEGVARGPVALAAHLDRAGGGAVGDPRDRDVEVDAGAGVGRDRAGHLAEDEPEAREGTRRRRPWRAGRRTTWPHCEAMLRRAPCGGSLRRPGVDHVGLLGHRGVEQGPDRLGVVLAVLVHRDDPLAPGRGDAGEGRRVLAEVAAQPDRAHPVVGAGQGADGVVGRVGAAVVDEHDLGDPVAAALRGDPVSDRGRELVDDGAEGALTLVDRDDDRDLVRRWPRALRLHAAHPSGGSPPGRHPTRPTGWLLVSRG